MIEIKSRKIKNSTVTVPGSKSYTHRMLIGAALSNGICRIENCLVSEDTILTQTALKQMGVSMDKKGNGVNVKGCGGNLHECGDEIYLGNSGTSMRLLAAVASLGKGTYRLTGNERMQQRPIEDLIDGLKQLSVAIHSVNNNGCPPLVIRSNKLSGGTVRLDCSVSSQYLSALLLVAPYTVDGIDIHVVHGPVSKPYIDMTVDVMEKLGVPVQRDGYHYFKVPGKQTYRAGYYLVEPDASQAGYFWAAAAITGAAIKVMGISRDSRQGDVGFTRILGSMGCRVSEEAGGISIMGGPLSAIETDMGNMPDLVPTLAIVAAFAKGTTVIKNVGHLRAKESDRLSATVLELNKIGIKATATNTVLAVEGGNPHGARIDTYNDHRIAMSFALAGLKVPGIFIRNESCVEKSFPSYWNVLETLYEQ